MNEWTITAMSRRGGSPTAKIASVMYVDQSTYAAVTHVIELASVGREHYAYQVIAQIDHSGPRTDVVYGYCCNRSC
jgi:hypothetical protein